MQASESTDYNLFVRTSDDTIRDRDRGKIADALIRETFVDDATAQDIAREVEKMVIGSGTAFTVQDFWPEATVLDPRFARMSPMSPEKMNSIRKMVRAILVHTKIPINNHSNQHKKEVHPYDRKALLQAAAAWPEPA